MNPLVILLAAVMLSAPARAQEATLNTPIARSSETKYLVDQLNFTRSPAQASIIISVQDASNITIRTLSFAVPGADTCPSATLAGLMTAIANPAANETGTDTRRVQFRLLTFLSAQSCISGITLVP